MKRAKPSTADTFGDRLAVAFGSGVFALLLGAFVWFAGWQWFATEAWIPFRYVVWFAAAMAVLGFLLAINVVAAILGGLMRGLAALWRSWWWP